MQILILIVIFTVFGNRLDVFNKWNEFPFFFHSTNGISELKSRAIRKYIYICENANLLMLWRHYSRRKQIISYLN